jgi:hypothetical protein
MTCLSLSVSKETTRSIGNAWTVPDVGATSCLRLSTIRPNPYKATVCQQLDLYRRHLGVPVKVPKAR